jgi:hypothetical protein
LPREAAEFSAGTRPEAAERLAHADERTGLVDPLDQPKRETSTAFSVMNSSNAGCSVSSRERGTIRYFVRGVAAETIRSWPM